MKIDVEGYEALVMEGSSSLFDRYHVRYIVAEYSPVMMRSKGSLPSSLLLFFHSRGYEVRHIRRGFNIDQQVRPNAFETFCTRADGRNRQCEILFVRGEDIDTETNPQLPKALREQDEAAQRVLDEAVATPMPTPSDAQKSA
jgi:hypothetical protein